MLVTWGISGSFNLKLKFNLNSPFSDHKDSDEPIHEFVGGEEVAPLNNGKTTTRESYKSIGLYCQPQR